MSFFFFLPVRDKSTDVESQYFLFSFFFLCCKDFLAKYKSLRLFSWFFFSIKSFNLFCVAMFDESK